MVLYLVHIPAFCTRKANGEKVSLKVRRFQYIYTCRTENSVTSFNKISVRNKSGIIAQHSVSNAKPSMVDLILQLPETNFQ